jgi:hypothetical protein
MPAVNATGVASVASGGAAQFNLGGIVYIAPIGYLTITAVNTGTNQLTLQNLGYSVNQAPGSIASSGATLTGTGPAGPAGSTGATGAAGPAGAAATANAGTTTTGAAGTNANVVNVGTPQAAVFNFTIPQGIQGVQGVQGTTGAAGPAGATGSQGPAGATGSQGPAGVNAYTLTSAQFTVPPVGGTVVVTFQNASWLVLGQYVEVKTAGGTSVSGTLQVTAINGNQVTLLNPSIPSLALANTTAAGLLVQVSGNATDYVGGDNACHSFPPEAVSADAGNLATIGSDSLISVPQSSIWSVRLRSFNAVGNPNFEVDQRNVGNIVTAPGTSTTVVDRWNLNKASSVTLVTSGGQVGSTGDVVLPGTNFRISRSYFRITLTTAQATLGAGDWLQLSQLVEGPNFRELQYDIHSVSLLVRSSVAGLKFSVALRDPATVTTSLCNLATIPNANTWTLIPFPNLPAFPSAGNFTAQPGVNGLQCGICLAAGSTMMSPANGTWQNGNFLGAVGMSNFAASPVNSTFDIAFIQHEPGAVCTTPIDKPFNQNYDECLRYFQKTYSYNTALGTVTTAGVRVLISPTATASGFGPLSFHKPMSKIPTITIYNHVTGAVNSVRDVSGVDHTGALATALLGETGFAQIQFTTALTGPSWIYAHYAADTGW